MHRPRPYDIIAIVATALLVLALPGAGSLAEGPLAVTIYHSPTCGHCSEFMADVWPEIAAAYEGAVVANLVDVSTPEGLSRLEADEARLGQRAPDVPVVIVGDAFLFDLDVARLGVRVTEAIDVQRAQGIVPAPEAPTPGGAVDGPGEAAGDLPPIHLAYVGKGGCSECEWAYIVLEAICGQYTQIVVTSFDVTRDAALVEAMGAHLGLPETSRLVAPSMYVGSRALGPEAITSDAIRALVEPYLDTGAPAFWEDLDVSGGRTSILARFERMGPVAVVVAGLIDGVNPCAFATILFFASYLAISRQSRSRLLTVGLAFTAGVFVTYLLVGLGAMRLLELASALSVVGPILYGVMAAGCLVLAVLSLRDYALARRGRLHEMTLNLPDHLRERIKGRIRATSGAFVGAAFVTGTLVSLLELACTGQVYLPTISFVVGVPELRGSAILYLVLYNVFFVVPLVAVLLLAAYGVSAARMQDWFVRNAAGAKLLMTALFFVLGGLLLVQAIGA